MRIRADVRKLRAGVAVLRELYIPLRSPDSLSPKKAQLLRSRRRAALKPLRRSDPPISTIRRYAARGKCPGAASDTPNPAN